MKANRVKHFLLFSIALTIVTAILVYLSSRIRDEAVRQVTHTNTVINESQQLLSLLKDTETGQRGYIITGDSSYLTPFNESKGKISLQVEKLRALTSDNSLQRDFIDQKIKPMVELKLKHLEKSLEQYNTSGVDSAVNVIKSNIGKVAMDSLRSHIAKFSAREENLLEQRKERQEDSFTINEAVGYFSLSMILITSILALTTIIAKQKENEKLIKELELSNQGLEVKVKVRTNEILRKNQEFEQLNYQLEETIEELNTFYNALQIRNVKAESLLNEITDLYTNAPCGYHSLSSDGTLIRMNKTELNWLGYQENEVIDKKTIYDIIAEDMQADIQPTFLTLKKQGYLTNYESIFVRKDGSKFPVVLNSTIITDENGKYLMNRTTVFDMSMRKKMEEELRDVNARLVKVNEDKSTFLGIASHDLKSPLNAVLGLINLLKNDSENFTKEQSDCLQLIYKSGMRMKEMIEKLLDLQRLEHGKTMLNAKETNLTDLIAKSVLPHEASATKKEIKIVVDVPSTPILLNIDPLVTTQIVDNLVSNAIKFSYGGEIRVKLSKNHENILLEVQDQGPGIKPEEMHRLFKKFQKLSARPTGGETSSGLGLAITKELVDLMGGQISAESEAGKGSTFKVVLPLA